MESCRPQNIIGYTEFGEDVTEIIDSNGETEEVLLMHNSVHNASNCIRLDGGTCFGMDEQSNSANIVEIGDNLVLDTIIDEVVHEVWSTKVFEILKPYYIIFVLNQLKRQKKDSLMELSINPLSHVLDPQLERKSIGKSRRGVRRKPPKRILATAPADAVLPPIHASSIMLGKESTNPETSTRVRLPQLQKSTVIVKQVTTQLLPGLSCNKSCKLPPLK